MSLSSRNKGFVLIEALAAVVIIAVSLTLILQSFVGNFRSTVLLQEYTKALILAENHLDQVFATGIKDRVMSEGSFPVPMERFHYRVGIKSLNEQDMPGLKRFDLAVIWPSGKKNREVSLSTWLTSENVQQTTQTKFYN